MNGDEIIVTVRDCGCWHETHYSPLDGDITLIRMEICGKCFEAAGDYLDTLDKHKQLTLDLPSAEGDRRQD